MSKAIFRSRSNGFLLALAIMLLGCVFVITSCGGGGGGGGVTGITYDGLTTQATVSSTNASTIFSAVWNGGTSLGSGPLTKVSSTSGSGLKPGGMVALFKQLEGQVLSSATGFAAQSNKVMVPQSETIKGNYSGYVNVTGSIDSITMLGSLTMTFVNFSDDGSVTTDGTIQFRIDAFDTINGIINDGTMSFTLWRTRGANFDISLTGSIRAQDVYSPASETLTVNLDGRDNSTGETFRFRNFVEATFYDNLIFPTTYTETISGRAYVRDHGYVDVTTTTPLHYTLASQAYPDSGGPMILTGAGGAQVIITPSASNVTIEVDLVPGDGIIDDTATYAWSDLSTPL